MRREIKKDHCTILVDNNEQQRMHGTREERGGHRNSSEDALHKREVIGIVVMHALHKRGERPVDCYYHLLGVYHY